MNTMKKRSKKWMALWLVLIIWCLSFNVMAAEVEREEFQMLPKETEIMKLYDYSKSSIVGTYHIDREKTMSKNGVSMWDLFGHDYPAYGDEMTLTADNKISFYIGVGIGRSGEYGAYAYPTDRIQYYVDNEYGEFKPGKLDIVSINGNIYIVQDYRDYYDSSAYPYKIYWKNDSKDSISNKIVTVKAENYTAGVKLTWNKVTGAEGYYIYRKTESGSIHQLRTIMEQYISIM